MVLSGKLSEIKSPRPVHFQTMATAQATSASARTGHKVGLLIQPGRIAKSTNPFRYFDRSPEVIWTVVMDVKYPVSLRKVTGPRD